jgi:hypothetical protein
MHCPICGQQQVSENVRFCSRCGFLLTGIAEVVANNGIIPNQTNQNEGEIKDSARKRGVKQGLMVLLVGLFLVLPLISILTVATDSEPYLVAITAIFSFFGGTLRMIYALMFESKNPMGKTLEQNIAGTAQNFLKSKSDKTALPPLQSVPVSDYVAPKTVSWRETNDLIERGSVTDNTTKLLQKEEEP